jgi:hypothetical protein
VIEIRELRKRYGLAVALDGMTFTEFRWKA